MMKLVRILLVALTVVYFTGPTRAQVPTVMQSGPQGFAALGSGTPGGNPKRACVVREANARALAGAIACARESDGGGVVAFGPGIDEIELARRLELPSDITIAGPVTLIASGAGAFRVAGQRNVVIRNITFRTSPGTESKRGRDDCPDPTSTEARAIGAGDNPGTTGCPVPITIQGTQGSDFRKGRGDPTLVRNSENVWIDHNTFVRCGDKCIVVKNGQQDNEGRWTGANNVTISNNLFKESFFAVFVTLIDLEKGARAEIGLSAERCEPLLKSGKLPETRVTVYGNLFDEVRRRSVRGAYCNAYVHEFNNVIRNFGLPLSRFPPGSSCRTAGVYGFGPSATFGARLLLENNYIAAWPNDPNGCKAAISLGDGHEDSKGYVADRGNQYTNGAYGGSNRPERVPAAPYTYSLMAPAQAYDYVIANAGTLKSTHKNPH